MKVLDLQCVHLHVFEGWFASEDDFSSQLARGLVTCPVCGDASISKRLSAPRLNLGGGREVAPSAQREAVASAPPEAGVEALQAAWLALARKVIQNTDDVGDRFAQEAREMHYGEKPERGIRGRASREETQALQEEGIAVMPLLLPDAFKGQLQ